MTVCGIKHADGVCVMGECPHIKQCCPVVWDKSGKPMTNEEWFNGLTTKEKAKFISELMHHRSKYSFEMEKFLLDGAETHEQAVEMWLKEKHDGNTGRNP